jgi:hypothetical protein
MEGRVNVFARVRGVMERESGSLIRHTVCVKEQDFKPVLGPFYGSYFSFVVRSYPWISNGFYLSSLSDSGLAFRKKHVTLFTSVHAVILFESSYRFR